MTGNHLLLYRLAELMLEHEQHILPVDLLFDDEHGLRGVVVALLA